MIAEAAAIGLRHTVGFLIHVGGKASWHWFFLDR
jgi:hypothetical protein